MIASAFFLAICALAECAQAQPQPAKGGRGAARVRIEFVVTAPESTPEDDALFVAGNVAELGSWESDGLKLVRGEDGKHRAAVRVARDSELEFKITRGTWTTVEKGPEGGELENRRHVAAADAAIDVVVVAWADRVARKSSVTGTLERHEGFGLKSGLLPRAILVWLPPGYAEDEKLRCPVLYMQDGQNLFDAATGFNGGEWGVDEACDRLVREGKIPPLIVVGVENTRARLSEYTPTPDVRHTMGGRADDYARMLLDEVKPFVDGRYRTLPGREHTFVGGSSLGGLASLWIAKEHCDAFGGAAALSPALTWDSERLRHQWAMNPPAQPLRLWFDVGTREGAMIGLRGDPSNMRPKQWVDAVREFAKLLEHLGLERDRDFVALEVEGARHNEAAWAARFPDVVQFLFRKP